MAEPHGDPLSDPGPDEVLAELVADAERHFDELEERLGTLRSDWAELAERQWALALTDGLALARRRLEAIRGAAPTQPLGERVADLLELSSVMRDQLYATATVEDLAAEIAETAGEPEGSASQLYAIERHADGGLSISGRLHEFAIAVTEAGQNGAVSMSEHGRTDGPAKVTNEFLYEVLGALSAGKAAPPPTASSAGVPDSMAATLEALGLPQVGGGLRFETQRPEMRALVIDSLRRSFDYRDRDGVRTYYRVQRLAPVASRPGELSAGLHGPEFVRSEQMRFLTGLVLQFVEELPSLLPYTPTLASYNALQLKERIRSHLDELANLVAEPLGASPQQVQSKFRWLLLAIADWLEGGQIIENANLRDFVARRLTGWGDAVPDFSELMAMRPEISLVASRETKARLQALSSALTEIGGIVFATSRGDVGQEAARVEQILTLLGASAAALKAELDRLGVSPAEQEVAFFIPPSDGRAGVSISQFVRWAVDISANYARAGDLAATLRKDELQVLDRDLQGLAEMAGRLKASVEGVDVNIRLAGALRQLNEVLALVDQAAATVAEMAKAADRNSTAA